MASTAQRQDLGELSSRSRLAIGPIQTSLLIEAWPAELAVTPPNAGWVVAYARPRQERRLLADLHRAGIGACMVLERRLRRYRGTGPQIGLVPLMTGYVFVHLDQRSRDPIYEHGRALRVLAVDDQICFSRELQDLLRLATCASGPVQVRPELVPGRRVTMREGIFAGCSGVISRRQGMDQLVVNLSLLGTSVAVTLPAVLAEAE